MALNSALLGIDSPAAHRDFALSVESEIARQIDEAMGHPPETGELAPEVGERRGFQDLVYGVQPLPGTDFVYAVPGSVSLWPLSVLCTLTTSNHAADRSVTLEYRDGDGHRFLVAGANVTQAASQTQSYCWQPSAGVGSWAVDDVAIAPLPQQFIYATHSVAIHVGSADTADQLSSVRISGWFYPSSLS